MNKTVVLTDPKGATLQVAPRTTSSAIVTAGHQLTAGEIDWGAAERALFRRSRALGDGEYRRGSAWGKRTVTIPIQIDVLKTPVEAIRDDAYAHLVRFLGKRGEYTLTQTRLDASGGSISRFLKGELTGLPAWKASLRSLDDGMVGPPEAGHARLTSEWDCGFPWFRDTAVSATTGAVTLDSTLRNSTINNTGDQPCGVVITISGAGSGLSFAILNGTSGASSSVVGDGLVIDDIDMADGDLVIDWYGTDPRSRTILQGTASRIANLAAGSGLSLDLGSNTVTYQVTAGTLTGGTITIQHYRLWDTP